ncbi:MAG: hypothetical protein ACQER9_03545 [Nanobdellota archaeon]
MENLIIKLIAVFAGISIARFAFSKIVKKQSKKREFMSEYMDAVNNPEYKIKGNYN